jgi:hypothetical protein
VGAAWCPCVLECLAFDFCGWPQQYRRGELLVEELGADVNQEATGELDGATLLIMAVTEENMAMARVLVEELGADVNQVTRLGATPLHMAAMNGHFDMVHKLVDEYGADVNLSAHDGGTALMAAAHGKHDKVIRFLTKHVADIKASSVFGTAANISKVSEAPAEQTVYLEAKMHCFKPGCDGAGLRKCQVEWNAGWHTGHFTRRSASAWTELSGAASSSSHVVDGEADL